VNKIIAQRYKWVKLRMLVSNLTVAHSKQDA
jgi:hypothetical protein